MPGPAKPFNCFLQAIPFMDGVDCLLVKVGAEIGVKSLPVRHKIVQRLKDNLRTALKKARLSFEAVTSIGLVLTVAGADPKQAVPVLQRVFGVNSIIHAKRFSPVSLESVCATALPFSLERVRPGKSFAVRAHRVGHHDFSSKDIENKLGRMILDAQPKAKVNLGHPDAVVEVEVRDDAFYLCLEELPGVGGYPVGAQGSVGVFFEGNPEEAFAAWLVMKRGCSVYPIVVSDGPKVEPLLARLVPWNSGMRFKPYPISQLAQAVDWECLAALVKADESIDPARFQAFDKAQPLPVLRPLLLYPARLAQAHRKLLEASA